MTGTKPTTVTLMTGIPTNGDKNVYWWKLEHISKVTYSQKFQVMIACNIHIEPIKLSECYLFLAFYVQNCLLLGQIVCLLHILKTKRI